jgi:protein ImuB
MPVAEAVALDHSLTIEEEDAAGNRHALKQLAAWAERYGPIVGLEEGATPCSLLLDVTGCAGCFGGENNLLRLAQREFAAQGWVARVALADTVGAAWGLAHYAPMPLGRLPVAALRLPAETVGLLAALGIGQVGQLEALPRPSLPARFGSLVLRRLDQLFGRLAEPIEPHRFLPDVRASCSLDYPGERLDLVQRLADQLAGEIHEGLRERNQGARQVECWLYHEANPPQRLEIGLSRPQQSERYLAELLRTRLERTRLTAPVSGMSLRVLAAEPLRPEQIDLFDGERTQRQKDLAGLIDRLSGRLGGEAVARAVLVADPQPEYAYRFESWIPSGEGAARRGSRRVPTDEQGPAALGEQSRPLRLQEPAPIEVVSMVPEGPPLRFIWSKVNYVVLRSWGPERIEAGWWRGRDVGRDYYIVATRQGARFWIFRRPADGRWFLHGCFD